ncbi:MAG: TonB-dependent receptor plug domain-containing protein [Desulfamplus sp.]|nr:TonB-dependent receptor plug domain-containing protein [Desulfamplus sp.]
MKRYLDVNNLIPGNFNLSGMDCLDVPSYGHPAPPRVKFVVLAALTSFIISMFLWYQCRPVFSNDLDATMAMFVGESLDVVTVASRTPESPSTAPAVVRVVDRATMEKRGHRTLADILATEPGFYFSHTGAGSLPYVRGISNGVLILHDGVPVPTGGTRSYYPLDTELSLHGIKRVEIIRGPGSVLWGPDAFAAIVNLVPFKGSDPGTTRAMLTTGPDSMIQGFASRGHKSKNWDAYISLYGGRDRHREMELPGSSLFETSPLDDSDYYELTANLSIDDKFTFSGRFSDFNKSFHLYDSSLFAWPGEKKAPVNYLKAGYSGTTGRSHWNLTAYYQDVTYHEINAGTSLREIFDLFYGELLWDRRIFEKGLATAGLSIRENHVKGALAAGGFMPDLLLAEYRFFVQPIEQMDYKNTLKSFFSQYRHPFSWGEFWAGFRLDNNSMYDDNAITYTMGINVPMDNGWRFKTVLGSGYRTPYSQQLMGEERLERDEITTLNLHAEWTPDRTSHFSATAYVSRLWDNVQTDPQAGISKPSDQDFSGIELNFRREMLKGLEGYLSFSKVFYSGDPYDFNMLRQTIYREDGSRVDVYDNWHEEYDPGAPWSLSLGFSLQVNAFTDMHLSGLWTAPIPYSYLQNTIVGEHDNPLLVNGSIRIKGYPFEKFSFSVGGKNILGRDFIYPGFYGPLPGNPSIFYFTTSFEF